MHSLGVTKRTLYRRFPCGHLQRICAGAYHLHHRHATAALLCAQAQVSFTPNLPSASFVPGPHCALPLHTGQDKPSATCQTLAMIASKSPVIGLQQVHTICRSTFADSR